jgi:Major capsid protein Gp23
MKNKALIEKWAPILEHADMPVIKDSHRRAVTAQLLENQKISMGQQAEALTEDTAPTNVTSNVGKYDPVLISLVRRSMPNLIAYDVCGVQPMTGPTGLIFAMRPKFAAGGSLTTEAFYNEADSDFSGTGTQAGSDPSVLNDTIPGTYTNGVGMTTAAAEALGSDTGGAFAQMGFEIEKVMVEAKSRALKAQYSVELAQDLKQIHGLDAETELANILSSEILAELNREVIRSIYVTAKAGAQNTDLTTAGAFDLDTDSNGRWSVEKFKGMLFQIEREANSIARETRRGKGNFIICSSDVASALAMAGVLDYAPALSTDLQVDDTGNTFAGILQGRYKVFIDPYAGGNFFVVGYKGASSYDAGIYYAPYVPLQLYKAVSDETFQPKIGFKMRYGMVANPFAQGLTKGNGVLNANTNNYFRRVKVANLTGTAI